MKQTSSAPGAGHRRPASAGQEQPHTMSMTPRPQHRSRRGLNLKTRRCWSFDQTLTRLRPRSPGFRCACQTWKGSEDSSRLFDGPQRLPLPHLYLNGPQRPRQRARQHRPGNGYPSGLSHGPRRRLPHHGPVRVKLLRTGRTRVRRAVALLRRPLLPVEAASALHLCHRYLFPTSESGTGNGWLEATGLPASASWR